MGTDPGTRNVWGVVRRIMPDGWMAYLLHMRPRAWAVVSAHMSIGFVLALGVGPAAGSAGRWLLAMLAWGVLGNGGTLALNSAFDRDEGDIGYLENPPPVPSYLGLYAIASMLLGAVVAAFLGSDFLLVYAICVLLSILYSVPPVRLKARAGWDIILNSAGYGALTLYAGWVAGGGGLSAPMARVVAAFFCFFVGFYPLTQIYQMGEDATRGDRTTTLVLGKRRALQLAYLGVVTGFTLLFVEALSRPMPFRAIGLVVALGAWGVVLVPWYRSWSIVSVGYEQRGFYRALYAWALTDVAALIALVPLS